VYKRYLIPAISLIIALLLFAGSSSFRISKAQWLSKTIFFPFSQTIRFITDLQDLRKQNFELNNKLTLFSLKNLELNNRLKELQTDLTFRFETGNIPFAMAEVIGYSGQFHDRNLIINKGRNAGISADCPVVSAEGIIGKVIVANPHNSIVLPMTNTQFQLAVMDKNTFVQGILQSDLHGNIFMNLIKLGSQISIGDTVVTSNLSRLYPKGYPIGKISMIKESQDNLFLSAKIIPFVFVENLEHVFVLIKSYTEKQNAPPAEVVKPDSVRM